MPDEELLATLAALIVVWEHFKRTHRLDDAKVSCCETTQMLFAALDALEKNIKQGEQGE